MKISQILSEMPEFVNRELPKEPLALNILSIDTLDREFDLLAKNISGEAEGQTVIAAIRKDRASAVIGYMAERDDGKLALRIQVMLEFHAVPDIGDIKGECLQVDVVQAAQSLKGAGYGYQLYKAIINKGFTIISDNCQYIGGKELWKKIVRRAATDSHTVHIMKHGRLIRNEDNTAKVYDGTNIPEDVIWGKPGSMEHHHTLLVATNQKL